MIERGRRLVPTGRDDLDAPGSTRSIRRLRPTSTPTWRGSPGTRSPSSIGYRDEDASRGPMTTLAADTWTTALDFLYGHAADRAMGDTRPHDVLQARVPRRQRARPCAGRPDDGPRRPRRIPAADRGRPDEQPASPPVRLLHAAAAADVDDGRAPRPDDQPGGRCLARRPGRRVRRGGGRPVAVRHRRVRRGRFRAAHVRRRDGQFHGDGPRPRRPSGATGRGGRPPRGAMLDGVRVYTSDQTHFSIARALDLLGFPPETLVVVEADERFHLRAAPVAAAVARDRAAGLRAVRDRGRRRFDEHRLGRCRRRAGRRRGTPRTCGSTWTRPTAERPVFRRRDAGRVPDLERADSVTVDPHKWFFQAYDIGGLLVRDGAAAGPGVRRPGTGVLPRRRDGATRRGDPG